MAKCIRIAADTQLAMNVPIRIMGAKLVTIAGDVTTAGVYDQLKSDGLDATKKVIALANTTTKLIDEPKLPKDGLLLTEGCYVEWTKGEVFIYIKE